MSRRACYRAVIVTAISIGYLSRSAYWVAVFVLLVALLCRETRQALGPTLPEQVADDPETRCQRSLEVTHGR